MAKTLNEVARELKEFIVELQSDAHNSGGVNKYRYNNLKVNIADPRTTKNPEIIITIGMSEATFNMVTKEKISGGLGPDERYVIRWLGRDTTSNGLKEIYQQAVASIGKANSEITDN